MSNTQSLYRPTAMPLFSLLAPVLLVALGCLAEVNGQWTTSGNDIYNSNSGNVGVGTTSPGVKLDILSTTNLIARFGSSGSAHTQVLIDAPSGFNANLTFQRAGVSKWYLGNRASNDRLSFIESAGAVEVLTLLQDGKVGVGTITPTATFHVMGASGVGEVLRVHRNASSVGWGVAQLFTLNNSSGTATDYAQISAGIASNTAGAESGDLVFHTRGSGTLTERVRVNSSGNVGVGTGSPGYRLDVQGGSINTSGSLCIAGDCKSSWSAVGSSQWTTSGATINYSTGNVGIDTASPTEKLHVTGNAKVTGSIDVGGNINAKYQDLAEWVESSQQLPAATVVVLDDNRSNQVIASTQAYDSRVAGVISRQPGIALGEKGEGRVLVATTGRVKVKVDASNGPIKIGDLLVTSDKEGFAMKSVPVRFGGLRMHRPGTLIGKALEPLARGTTGEILVLLSLQ